MPRGDYARFLPNVVPEAFRPGPIIVTSELPQRAQAPGQSVGFYGGDEVLGGGLIAADLA